jgi:hypothetical protein
VLQSFLGAQYCIQGVLRHVNRKALLSGCKNYSQGSGSFIKVLNEETLEIQITGFDRISLTVGPASSDDDLSKGLMIYLGGKFTEGEMNEIRRLGTLADKGVTNMVAVFVAKQAAAMQKQGLSGTHEILGQASTADSSAEKKWWQLWK